MLDWFDFFSTQPYITHQKQPDISTNFSKLLSLMFYIVTSYLIVQKSIQLNKQYEAIETYSQLNHFDFKVNRSSEMISLRFQNQTINNELLTYYEPQIQVWHSTQENSFDIVETIPLEKCNLKHFDQMNQTQYDQNQLKDSFCLPYDYQALFKKNDTFESGIQISLLLCKQSISNTNCVDLRQKKNLENYLDKYPLGQFIIFNQYNKQLFLSDFQNPHKYQMNQFYASVSVNSEFKIEFQQKVQQFQLIQDFTLMDLPIEHNSIKKTTGLNSDQKTQKIMQIHRKTDQIFNNALCDIYITASQQQLNIQVNSQKLQDLIVWLIGSLQVFSCIIQNIAKSYNDKYYFLKLNEYINGEKKTFYLHDILTWFDLDLKLGKKVSKQISKSIDSKSLINNFHSNRLLKNSVFNEKMFFVLKTLKNPPQNFNQILNKFKQYINKYPQKYYKFNKNRCQFIQVLCKFNFQKLKKTSNIFNKRNLKSKWQKIQQKYYFTISNYKLTFKQKLQVKVS